MVQVKSISHEVFVYNVHVYVRYSLVKMFPFPLKMLSDHFHRIN